VRLGTDTPLAAGWATALRRRTGRSRTATGRQQ
jgi:hypothetical protein